MIRKPHNTPCSHVIFMRHPSHVISLAHHRHHHHHVYQRQQLQHNASCSSTLINLNQTNWLKTDKLRVISRCTIRGVGGVSITYVFYAICSLPHNDQHANVRAPRCNERFETDNDPLIPEAWNGINGLSIVVIIKSIRVHAMMNMHRFVRICGARKVYFFQEYAVGIPFSNWPRITRFMISNQL